MNLNTIHIHTSLEENLQQIKTALGNRDDLVVRTVVLLPETLRKKCALLFLNGMVDLDFLHTNVLEQLLKIRQVLEPSILDQCVLDVLSATSVCVESDIHALIHQLTRGYALIFIDGEARYICIESSKYNTRAVSEPSTETVVKGPREGFIEDLDINLSLLRRKIRSHNLQIERLIIGKQTRTSVCISYIRGLVKDEIVSELRRRLKQIEIDGVFEVGYIEQLIEDHRYSVFPTCITTERPDTTAAKLLEGRVAILVDGTPNVMLCPALFVEFFQNSEDYYIKPYYASFARILRYLAFFMSTFSPSLYIAFESFEKELIPTSLINSFSEAREGVPFPLTIEVFLMVIVFEWLREAGVRMPRPIGQAVSIVGALVIGQAAVSAGIIGAPTVIVIAGAGITSFVVPMLFDVMTLFRILSILVVGFLGLYGEFLLWYGMLIYLSGIRSFGIPYLSPLAPLLWREWGDAFIRLPLNWLRQRPQSLEMVDQVRMQPDSLEKQDKEDNETT
ncbi:spore germination protein [Fodinisporobacter ferrooxydans]|uniref:Spore germination protein n=1 Tax=Fodinisporobacter ferrooxydans TaxID=2901836 RepID=A0ABY4CHL8_9BACL|nr:spore germination protein [Alicyclobacillaceae bacterium MYW30-H2]